MYLIKKEQGIIIKKKFKQAFIANEVGISIAYISLILSGKKTCSKRTAYCIAKTINENAEIDDFFDKLK